MLELNGETRNTDEVRGTADEDTGGRVLFFAPGLQIIHNRFILEASYQIPVAQRWNGNDSNRRAQFTIEERIRGGIRVVF